MATPLVVYKKNYPRLIQTYTLVTIALLLAGLAYGYFQFQKLSSAQSALAEGRMKVTQMTAAIDESAEQYSQLKRAHDESFMGLRESIEAVFPSDDRYTELTRILDDFVLQSNETGTMFMSNLRFNKARVDEGGNYSILPFSLTLSTTPDNLGRFLEFVENSGSLEDGTRLMDVQAISISFPQSSSGFFGTSATSSSAASNLLNVSFSVNSYYQIPPDKA